MSLKAIHAYTRNCGWQQILPRETANYSASGANKMNRKKDYLIEL
jgi:hypothetical protein